MRDFNTFPETESLRKVRDPHVRAPEAVSPRYFLRVLGVSFLFMWLIGWPVVFNAIERVEVANQENVYER